MRAARRQREGPARRVRRIARRQPMGRRHHGNAAAGADVYFMLSGDSGDGLCSQLWHAASEPCLSLSMPTSSPAKVLELTCRLPTCSWQEYTMLNQSGRALSSIDNAVVPLRCVRHQYTPARQPHIEISYAAEGKRLRFPFAQQWLNSEAAAAARFNATAVQSACISTRVCAPDFLILGTGHAGSTSLYALLVQHPQLLPSRVKELNFFGLQTHWLRHDGYARLFPAGKLQRPGQLVGEASPYYLSNPVAPFQLRSIAPRAKLLSIIRAPPDHCWSASADAVTHAFNATSSEVANWGNCPIVTERAPSRVLAGYAPCDPLDIDDGSRPCMYDGDG